MRARLTILGLLGALALLGLLCVHGYWLARGPRNPRFVRMMRRAHVTRGLPDPGTAVDWRGRPLAEFEPGTALRRAVDDLAVVSGGEPVRLSLDAELQTRAEALLEGRTGAVVALEPTTGRIRALVSAPRTSALDRALNGLYPPGSTFKVFLAAAALSAGVDPVFTCTAEGYRSSRGTPAIRDVEARQAERRGRTWRGFGKIGMGEALMHSSNTYFAQLGVALGPDAFGRAVGAARLRDPVKVLEVEGGGVSSAGCGVPEGLRAAQLAPVAIGQGALQLTPLAVAMITAAVADDGVLVQPTLREGERPVLRARPFAFEAAQRVKKMMRRAVQAGTARGCDVPGLDVCGKTGTAQTGRGADHAWLTCFAPEARPRLVVTVLVEEGGFGAESAVPIARELLLEARRGGLVP